jgi:hypothetical protein
MVVLAERRSSRAALWAGRLSTFAAVLFVASGLGHRFGLVETVGFLWILGLVATLALGALILAAAGFFQLWTYGDRGGISSARAILVALLVLSPFLVSAWRVYAFPQLSDISTDVGDPPPLDAAARQRNAGMNPVTAISAAAGAVQSDFYPDITGRRYPLSADRVEELAAQLVLDNGWTFAVPPVAPTDGGDGLIEALASTAILAFPVDVSIRITDEGETSYVDMRSASRYGHHDLGDNAARIAGFLTALDAAVAGAAGPAPGDQPPPAGADVPIPTEPPSD